ncbi:uncharacterized protein LOC119069400 [Bradysia coprophila]|uniref:uncharacterized protein LOC119069400 n=1 Tax=Bradysia coprophila TaxID=38358 RepID=UPI00187DB551|nr:uncharacterized protein LOC119069400 [Bradysia coprophila]
MKIGFVLIVCVVIQQNTVGGQTLPELLKDAQSQTDELHSVVTSALLKFRMEMSNTLTETVNECLSHILNALESQQLSSDTSDELNIESESIGNQISRCSAQADQDIQAAVKQFFAVLTPIDGESLTVLNTVLDQIVEWNITSDPRGIVSRVHNMLEVKNNEFMSNALPFLEEELRKFKRILLVIPSTVSQCVGDPSTN